VAQCRVRKARTLRLHLICDLGDLGDSRGCIRYDSGGFIGLVSLGGHFWHGHHVGGHLLILFNWIPVHVRIIVRLVFTVLHLGRTRTRTINIHSSIHILALAIKVACVVIVVGLIGIELAVGVFGNETRVFIVQVGTRLHLVLGLAICVVVCVAAAGCSS